MPNINKDTAIYGSFSQKPGNLGCLRFNKSFEKYGINAIYKSFYIQDIKEAVSAAKTLGFSGFAVSAPFKIQIIPLLDSVSKIACDCGSVNTVLVENGVTYGTNTDILAIKKYIKKLCPDISEMTILGNGGYAQSALYAAKELGIKTHQITRHNWQEIGSRFYEAVFNCTPLFSSELPSFTTKHFINCDTESDSGKTLSYFQADCQFKIYTHTNHELCQE